MYNNSKDYRIIYALLGLIFRYNQESETTYHHPTSVRKPSASKLPRASLKDQILSCSVPDEA